MLPQILEQISVADLNKLIADQEQEGTYIEYKRELYRLDAPDQKYRGEQHEELLNDVSSFANEAGGDLIVGMDEDKGIPTTICGIEIDDPDALKLRLSEIIQKWLDPKITVPIHFVKIDDKRFVFIFRILRSLLAPHRVVYAGRPGQFWGRNSGGAYVMDTTQLRRSFTLSETIFDRIKTFRENRVGQIINNQMPVLMSNGPKLILHLIPIESFATRLSFLPETLQTLIPKLRPLNSTMGCSDRINMDGIVICDNVDHRKQSFGYVQIYRNGIIEVVADDIVNRISNDPQQIPYFITHYEKYLLERLPEYLEVQRTLGIPPPIWLFLTLANVKGMSIFWRRNTFPKPPIDRSILYLPETEITDLSGDSFSLLKPLYDIIWNAAGYPRSLSFNNKNEWVPPQ